MVLGVPIFKHIRGISDTVQLYYCCKENCSFFCLIFELKMLSGLVEILDCRLLLFTHFPTS